jgi:chromatin segregation and condensation protein Rec8/ScpA/Scc1 (kleisin family)
LSKQEKPYYLRQPWDVLFKEAKLEKVSPWNIDLALLLTTLLKEMEKVGIDFRIAGTAIQSSVLIYLKKAEMLMKFEEIPSPKEESTDIYVPPALPLPFRFEHTTTTVNDLIDALEKALSEKSKTVKPKSPIFEPEIPDFLEVERYLLEIESRSEALLEEIRWRNQKNGEIKLTSLVYGQEWIEIVRIFMMLLFLAQRLKIEINQPEDESEIFIKIMEGEHDSKIE